MGHSYHLCSSLQEGVDEKVEEALGTLGHPGLVSYPWLDTKSPWELSKNSFLSPIPGVLSQNVYG